MAGRETGVVTARRRNPETCLKLSPNLIVQEPVSDPCTYSGCEEGDPSPRPDEVVCPLYPERRLFEKYELYKMKRKGKGEDRRRKREGRPPSLSPASWGSERHERLSFGGGRWMVVRGAVKVQGPSEALCDRPEECDFDRCGFDRCGFDSRTELSRPRSAVRSEEVTRGP